LFNYCETGFSIEAYNAGKKSFVPVALPVNAYAGTQTAKKIDSPHPELYKQLRRLRDKICSELDAPIYFVAGSVTLDEMARYLPQSAHELTQVSGFGKVKTQQFGDRFLEIINAYCEANSLTSNIAEKKPKRERKEKKVKAAAAVDTAEEKPPAVNTKQESYNLYRQNKSIEEIAELRNMTTQTIEGHLAHFIQQGLISVDELVSREKLVLIEPVLDLYDGKSLKPLKDQLGNAVSYGDIRLAVAWKEFQKGKDGSEQEAPEEGF
jgi:ATP-dependent DNA helicase RecQ